MYGFIIEYANGQTEKDMIMAEDGDQYPLLDYDTPEEMLQAMSKEIERNKSNRYSKHCSGGAFLVEKARHQGKKLNKTNRCVDKKESRFHNSENWIKKQAPQPTSYEVDAMPFINYFIPYNREIINIYLFFSIMDEYYSKKKETCIR